MIAVDAMGGDFAPHEVIAGALNAARENVPVMLFGPATLLTAELTKLDAQWSCYPITIANAPELIGMAENPVLSVKKKHDSSLVKAVVSVKERHCTGVISAGNSGALMAAATFILGRAQDVERPAIVGLLPGIKGPIVGLDLGANVDCRPQHLCQFAHMGVTYASEFLGIKHPTVALLANGEEEGKGSALTKQAFDLLKNSMLNFIGNIEPRDVIMNKADVVVCDGFTGNIFLKTLESFYPFFAHTIKTELNAISSLSNTEKDVVKTWGEQMLEKVRVKFAAAKQGGATLLGVNGRVIVCHGNSNAQTIKQAILFAASSDRSIQVSNQKFPI